MTPLRHASRHCCCDREGIHEDALQHLVQQNAVREFVVGRDASRTKWTFSVCLGGPHSRLIPVRSRLEVIRTWASLTALGRFAEGLGMRGFAVEL